MEARILSFGAPRAMPPAVGTVHRDGSVTYDGVTYASIKDVPPGCRALRLDVASEVQWRILYSAIDPKRRPSRSPQRVR